jgi:hypothetical protein
MLSRVHDTLRQQVRQAEGRSPLPSAALLDAQALRGAETVPRRDRDLMQVNA